MSERHPDVSEWALRVSYWFRSTHCSLVVTTVQYDWLNRLVN